MYEVINRYTGKTMRTCETRCAAHAYARDLNVEYGKVRYIVLTVKGN